MEKDAIIRTLGELFGFEFTIYNLSFVYISMLFALPVKPYKVLLVTIAFFAARSSAFLMNRYIGRDLDLKNKKKARMPSLGISKNMLLAMFALLSIIFLTSAYLLNTLAFIISPIILAIFIIDPILKSHSGHRHFLIGVMESFDALAGYIGVTGSFPTTPPLYILMLSIIFIGGGFDMLLTIRHIEFDKKHGLKTYPTYYGIKRTLSLSIYSHAIASIFLITFAIMSNSYIILAGAIASILIIVAEHTRINIKNDKELMSRAMVHNTSVAVVMLLAVSLSVLI